jgi:PAS domain S-box-containing protein
MKNILTSNFQFSLQEHELQSRVMAINVLLMGVAPLISIMSIFRFTHGNPQQGLIDFLFALISIFGLFWIRGGKDRINSAAHVGSFLSLFLTAALFILVPEDTLRIGWFLVLLVLTFFLAGLRIGLTISTLALIFLWTMYCTAQTNYSGYELFYFSTLSVMVTILLSFYEYRGGKNRLRLQSMNSELEEQVQNRTAELARTNKELQLFFYALDTSSDLVVISDMNGQIKYVNRSVLEYSGWNSTEVVDQGADIFCSPKNYVTDTVIPALKNQGYWEDEIQAVRKNGSLFPAFINSTVIFDDTQTALGTVYIIRDMSGIKQAEKKKLQIEIKSQQSSKMEAIGLMASGVAHDLNNILSGVINYPELLLLELAADDPLRPRIEKIQHSGQRAAAVVEDLLTVARGVAMAKQSSDLNTLLAKYLHSPEILRALDSRPGVELCTDFRADPADIFCSVIHIRKCLLNLVINGCEAIADKGTLTVATRNTSPAASLKITTAEIPPGNYVVLSVRDSGAGIPVQDIAHIFEPFYSKKVMGRSGTGIGLAVVWNVVQDHDGYIDVVSDSSGTCFDIYLPIHSKPADLAKPAATVPNMAGKGQTVLVIDDESSQRDIATSMLERLGYRATAVASGEDAVQYLNSQAADLLLLDMIMEPGMNGRKTYEQILFLHPSQKAVISSGFSETEEVKKTQALGAGGFIKKPYTLNQLGRAVQQGLAGD